MKSLISALFQLNRKFLLFCIVFVTGLLLLITYNQQNNNKEPRCPNCHVLLVSLDTCAARNIECYGYERKTAPNFCSLAKKSLFFTNTYANSYWTLPSHVSLFTGLYPENHKVNTYADSLSKQTQFLPEILQKSGYETIFYIKDNDPTMSTSAVYNRGITQIDSNNYDKDGYLEKALNKLISNDKEHKKTFMFFHTYKCHDPYLTEDEPKIYTTDRFPDIPDSFTQIFYPFTKEFFQYILRRLPETIHEAAYYNETETAKRIYTKLLQHATEIDNQDELKNLLNSEGVDESFFAGFYLEYYYFRTIFPDNKRQMDYLRALYDQKISQVDSMTIKKINETIANSPLKNNTVLIITSDHGEEFGEHSQITHKTLYDLILKIPLLILIPEQIPKTIQQNVQSVDIAPTLLELLDISNTEVFDGKSLLPLIRGIKSTDTLLIADAIGIGQTKKTIRLNEWKLFTVKTEDALTPYELYNIKQDPLEQQNVLLDNFSIAKKILDTYNEQTKTKITH